MKRIVLTSFLIIFYFFLQWPSFAWSQETTLVILKSKNIKPFEQAQHGFEVGLSKEQLKTAISVQNLEGKKDQDVDHLFDKIKEQKPAMVLAIGSAAALSAREHLNGIPVLFTMVLEPEKNGLLPPGVTIKLSTKEKLEILRRLLPKTTRIGVIYSAESEVDWNEIVKETQRQGYQVVGKKIESGDVLPSTFDSMATGIDLFFMVADSKLYAPKTVEYLLLASIKHEVPVVGLSSSYTKAGALVSLEYDREDSGFTAAQMAVRILKGQDPAALGYQHPSRILYSLNAEVAKRMKIHFSDEAFKNADEVFGQ